MAYAMSARRGETKRKDEAGISGRDRDRANSGLTD